MIAWVGASLSFSHLSQVYWGKKICIDYKDEGGDEGKNHINITSPPFFPWSTALETVILEIFQSGLQFKRFIKSRISTMRELDQNSPAVKFKGLLIHTYLQAAALSHTPGVCESQPCQHQTLSSGAICWLSCRCFPGPFWDHDCFIRCTKGKQWGAIQHDFSGSCNPNCAGKCIFLSHMPPQLPSLVHILQPIFWRLHKKKNPTPLLILPLQSDVLPPSPCVCHI